MILLEIISQLLFEELLEGFLGGFLRRANNSLLKLRGIETRSPEVIHLEKLRDRYLYKNVKVLKSTGGVLRGDEGIVLEIINTKTCFVEFENQNIVNLRITDIFLKEQSRT